MTYSERVQQLTEEMAHAMYGEENIKGLDLIKKDIYDKMIPAAKIAVKHMASEVLKAWPEGNGITSDEMEDCMDYMEKNGLIPDNTKEKE